MSDISIIIPAYNAEKYMRKCLDSLNHQTKKELEFII
ncbi:MAG: glycosyltransferase, partial [Bacilli bacterium]|nr:glycosyltransferase [Bacilli bacterium]